MQVFLLMSRKLEGPGQVHGYASHNLELRVVGICACILYVHVPPYCRVKMLHHAAHVLPLSLPNSLHFSVPQFRGCSLSVFHDSQARQARQRDLSRLLLAFQRQA
jgi:hypothetical protein